jgi:hypothetical protein
MDRLVTWLHITFSGTNLPTLTPMPKHVADVRLDRGLLLLHFERAMKPNPDVVTGYIPSTREKPAAKKGEGKMITVLFVSAIICVGLVILIAIGVSR